MNKPLVSIITPFYNAAPYLKATLQSVMDQTYDNWELIMINDGSKDNSMEIAKGFTDKRIKIITQANGGQCVATNNGIRQAQGEYIQLLDADDIMHPDKTRAQLEDLLREGDECLGVSKWAFFYNDPSEAVFRNEPVFFSAPPIDWLYQLWTNDTMMHTNSYMMPRKVMEKGGWFFDEALKLNIDFEFFARMTLASKKVVYSDKALGYYRKGVPGSKTHNPPLERQLSSLASRVKAIKHLLSIENSERTREAARMALTILTFSWPGILPYSKKQIKELGLGHFGNFKGKYFKYLTAVMGFENAIRAKKVYRKFRN